MVCSTPGGRYGDIAGAAPDVTLAPEFTGNTDLRGREDWTSELPRQDSNLRPAG